MVEHGSTTNVALHFICMIYHLINMTLCTSKARGVRECLEEPAKPSPFLNSIFSLPNYNLLHGLDILPAQIEECIPK